jgi:hypothetical protein
MKVKLKNTNSAVALLLAHGEKIGIVVIGALALLLVWKSLGRESLGENRQPEALKTAADGASRHVRDVSWSTIPPEIKVIADEAIEDPSLAVLSPVREGDFPISRQLNPPVTIPLSKRQDPVLLAPLDLEVHGGAGLWLSGDPEELRRRRLEAINKQQQLEREEAARLAEAEREADERRDRRDRDDRGRGEENLFGQGMGMAGGMKTKDGAIVVTPTSGTQLQGMEVIRNRYWVTVLAKIPMSQQHRMYEDALLNTRGYDPAKDVPDYFGYMVERAEITDEGQGPWQPLGSGVTAEGIANVMDTWPVTQTTELVSPQYVHPVLTYPLPPMILRPWGDDVTHSDMPLQTAEDILAELEAEAAEAEAEAAGEGEAGTEENEFSAFNRIAEMKRDLQRQSDPTRSMYGLEGAAGLEGSRMYGSSYGLEGGMRGMASTGEGGEFVLPTYHWDGKTEHILFRYFDSRVEPGKQYRYRVRLVLSDVNANQPEPLLDDKVKERKQKDSRPFFFTEWSEESPVATVPQPGLVFVKGNDLSANPTVSESEAILLVKSLDSQFAAEIGVAGEFARGSVLNLQRQAQIIWSSVYDPQQQPDSPVFDFFTGQTLVDFDGGEKLGSRVPLAPARALLMDAAGRMTVHNELEDVQSVAEFDAVIEADKAAARQRAQQNDDRGDRRRGRGR